MPDLKTTGLTADTLPVLTDIFPYVEEPGTVPLMKKMTFQSLFINSNFVVPTMQITVPIADFTLSAAAGVQSAFPTTGDVFTVKANTTYHFEGQYILNTGATTHTTALAFLLTTAVTSSFEYFALLHSAAINTLTTTMSRTHVSGVASKVLNATSTAVYTIIEFRGIARFTTGGTLTPQINFSANPTGTNLMKLGSYMKMVELGTDTFAKSGGWA